MFWGKFRIGRNHGFVGLQVGCFTSGSVRAPCGRKRTCFLSQTEIIGQVCYFSHFCRNPPHGTPHNNIRNNSKVPARRPCNIDDGRHRAVSGHGRVVGKLVTILGRRQSCMRTFVEMWALSLVFGNHFRSMSRAVSRAARVAALHALGRARPRFCSGNLRPPRKV